jgi:hypothetical protein
MDRTFQIGGWPGEGEKTGVGLRDGVYPKNGERSQVNGSQARPYVPLWAGASPEVLGRSVLHVVVRMCRVVGEGLPT